MYEIKTSKVFLKDLKVLKKRNQQAFNLLNSFIKMLVEKGSSGLDKKYRAHKLSGSYKGYWECHVKPDLLLIWKENEQELIIVLARTGTHSDLFK